MKNLIKPLAICLAAALSLSLAACGGETSDGGGSDGAKTEIRFLYATGDETWNATVKAVVDAYNAQSSIASVTPDPLPSGTDYATALKTMDATGNWPAVVDMRDTATYLDAGKLASIPEEVYTLLDDSSYAKADDGEVYTLPSRALVGELGIDIVYDKDYFAEHNLQVPTTYQEFIDLMEAIKANGDTPLATAAGEIWPADQLWKPLAASTFASHPAGFWQDVKDGKASVADLKEPLTRLKTIIDNYVLPGWQSTLDAQTTTLLVNHEAVMATSSAGLGRLMDISKVAPDFNAGMFIIPGDDGKIYVLRNAVSVDATGENLAISKQAQEDGAEYTAAVDFLKFFYSVPAANLMEENGWIAPNLKLADQIVRNDSIPGASDYYGLLNSPNVVFFSNETLWPNFTSFNTFFRQSRIEMQDNQTSIDDCIAKVQAEFDKTITNA